MYVTFLTDRIPQDENKALVFSCACAIDIPLYVHLIKQHVLKTTNADVTVIPNMCKVLQTLSTGNAYNPRAIVFSVYVNHRKQVELAQTYYGLGKKLTGADPVFTVQLDEKATFFALVAKTEDAFKHTRMHPLHATVNARVLDNIALDTLPLLSQALKQSSMYQRWLEEPSLAAVTVGYSYDRNQPLMQPDTVALYFFYPTTFDIPESEQLDPVLVAMGRPQNIRQHLFRSAHNSSKSTHSSQVGQIP